MHDCETYDTYTCVYLHNHISFSNVQCFMCSSMSCAEMLFCLQYAAMSVVWNVVLHDDDDDESIINIHGHITVLC